MSKRAVGSLQIPPSPPRTYHGQIAELQARIVAAESERDGWHTIDQDKFLDASRRVDELSLELRALRLRHLRNHTGGSC